MARESNTVTRSLDCERVYQYIASGFRPGSAHRSLTTGISPPTRAGHHLGPKRCSVPNSSPARPAHRHSTTPGCGSHSMRKEPYGTRASDDILTVARRGSSRNLAFDPLLRSSQPHTGHWTGG